MEPQKAFVVSIRFSISIIGFLNHNCFRMSGLPSFVFKITKSKRKAAQCLGNFGSNKIACLLHIPEGF
jgi:hypothetical protein